MTRIFRTLFFLACALPNVLHAQAPIILQQPQSQTVQAGQPASFYVLAYSVGNGWLTYQWQRNPGTGFVNLVGQTNATYTTAATTASMNGYQYRVIVSDSSSKSSTTSANATLSVLVSGAPSITTQPSSQTVSAGATATFSVTAAGTAPLSYQWRKNGSALSGATGSSYQTPATTTADNGATFSVVVSNGSGSLTSNNATLTVQAAVAPTITGQPASQTVTVGAAAIFSVTATGTAPLSYQWRKNGGNISGGTGSSYQTPATTSVDDGATFSVVVSNSAGSATSNNATLTLQAAVAPAITSQPANKTVLEGQSASFSVTASGSAPLSYQWRKNGANISGATSSSYTTSATVLADNGASYSVVVNNTAGSITSSNATLTVNPAPPTITSQPQNVTVNEGGSASFSVIAGGSAPLSYQWRKGGSAISGATASTLTISPVAQVDAGSYDVVVTNGAGGVTSSAATLTINAVVTISVSPGSASMQVGGTQSLSASVSGTANTGVSWTSSGGTLSGVGLSVTWNAPQVAGTYTVIVTSQADPTKSATASIRVNPMTCAP